MEAKFAPWFHTSGGLTPRAATEHMIRGFRRAERETGIEIIPVLCINREATPEEGIVIARIALDYDGEAMLDLACDEAEHPPEKHLPAYALTFGSNVLRSAHAGEWVTREPAATYRARLLENVRTSVRLLRCDDIGHAIPLPDDPELVREVVDKGIRISGCPLSNLSLGLIKDVRELRIAELIDAGVRYTLNADDDLFLPTMDEVIDACEAAYGFTETQCRALEVNCL
jgi:adenosine deaminase